VDFDKYRVNWNIQTEVGIDVSKVLFNDEGNLVGTGADNIEIFHRLNWGKTSIWNDMRDDLLIKGVSEGMIG